MSTAMPITFQLKPSFRELILDDAELMGKIAKTTGKHIMTVYRWAKDNDDALTTTTVLTCIREHVGGDEELTEKVA